MTAGYTLGVSDEIGNLSDGTINANLTAVVGDDDDVKITITDAGTQANIDIVLDATSGTVTTAQLVAGTYSNMAAGDKMASGLTFAASTSTESADDTDLTWAFAGSTLTFETQADASANVAVVLTGINSVTETGGVFTFG